jgi:hypothetical protein
VTLLGDRDGGFDMAAVAGNDCICASIRVWKRSPMMVRYL